MLRTVTYSRLSVRTDTNALNIIDQATRCREYAESRDWQVMAELSEFGSAYDRDSTDDRPQFTRLLELVQAREVDVVLAWRPDRLWRDPIEAALFMRTCHRHGVQLVVTVMEGERDPANPGDEMIATIVAAVSRYESAAKSARLRAKQRQGAERGLPRYGGRRSFGYDPTGWTIMPDEADAIRGAMRVFLRTRNLRAAARYLDAVGIARPQSKDAWNGSIVRQILTSPHIAGIRRHHGVDVADGLWPAIITKGERRRVLAALRDPSRHPPRRSPDSLLRGLVVCGHCGFPFYAYNVKDRHISYRCAYNLPYGGCGRIGRSSRDTDRTVVEALLAGIRGGVQPPTERTPTEAHLERVAALNASLERIADDRLRRVIDGPTYYRTRTELRDQLERLHLRHHGTTTFDPASIDRWDDMLIDERRAIVNTFLARVIIHPTLNKTSRPFDPTRIEIIWR